MGYCDSESFEGHDRIMMQFIHFVVKPGKWFPLTLAFIVIMQGMRISLRKYNITYYVSLTRVLIIQLI
jgi:hypothetical protein